MDDSLRLSRVSRAFAIEEPIVMSCWTGVGGIWWKGTVHQVGVLMKRGFRIAMEERIFKVLS